MKFHIPIRLPSLANERLHWSKVARLKRAQKAATRLCMRMADAPIPAPPLTITIVRTGPMKLDDDNLQAACKYVRDQIASIIGIDDGDEDACTWMYAQYIGEYGVDVHITSR